MTDPIGVDDMAAVVDAVPQAVEKAFRRHRGCAPMQAFERRRLELARRELESPGAATTVTGAAFDCGFFHLRRFSERYRNTFGEVPSATLRRGRPRLGACANDA